MARGMVGQTKNGVSVPWLGHPGAILRHPDNCTKTPQFPTRSSGLDSRGEAIFETRLNMANSRLDSPAS